jgi:hypothetical protein
MRALAFALVFALALPLAAAEKWRDAYDKGVAAVNAKNYRVGAEQLQQAIAERPGEGLNVRSARRELVTYVPHFWLGIAKFNLGDVDGALREWRISEEQGVLAKTDYYARMKEWVARAEGEKLRVAENAVAGPKKAADTAISRALESQLEALSAGGDRTADYASAQRKLQQARSQFQKGGTDARVYKTAEQAAADADALFRKASDEGRRTKAARATQSPARTQPPRPRTVPLPVDTVEVTTKAEEKTAAPASTATAAPLPVVSEAEAQKRIADQESRRRVIAPPAQKPATLAAVPATPPSVNLDPAYRAFASGDLAGSESLLNGVLKSNDSPEAYLLRGCARYTRAVLSRTPDLLLAAATEDFRAALSRKATLRLDPRHFSPKLVKFFEQVRQRM